MRVATVTATTKISTTPQTTTSGRPSQDIINELSTNVIERVLRRAATSAATAMAGRNISDSGNGDTNDSSIVENNGSLNINNNNNLAATIASIRTNVTRVLNLYFHNVGDEQGYGAPTTMGRPIVVVTASTPTGDASEANSSTSSALLDVHLSTHVATTSAATEATHSEALNATLATSTPTITYPNYRLAITSYENCSAIFANYTQPQQGLFCNWTWDRFLCWPPTPAGVLARMHCPAGWHGIDTRKFANRQCGLNGRWSGRPNETYNPIGWTDYQPCFKPEVNELMKQVPNLELFLEIAKRTRTLEIVGLILSLLALILSLIIFYNFRSLRNNRTKIHKNLFIAMVLQVIIRLTLYLDQAFRRGKQEATTHVNVAGIENTPYLCEASYVLLEYARTAMFMWMFIEGWYLHNIVTMTVFQGRFPFTIFTLVGWGMPVLMTTVWAFCTAIYHDSVRDCWWNYNLTPYYWILEGPRLIVILLNFFFLMNIIRVLVVKLRQSQASDIEQTRKAVRAAIVLLPLLGITNLLHLVPDLKTPWKFALWSYVTHFLTSFQGFFIALIYCFLNGEVRAALLKSLEVYMSIRGHPEWAPKRPSMYSAAYNTEAHPVQSEDRRNDLSPNICSNGSKTGSSAANVAVNVASSTPNNLNPQHLVATSHLSLSGSDRQGESNSYSISNDLHSGRHKWMFVLCFRGQKVLKVPPASSIPPESVVFELSET